MQTSRKEQQLRHFLVANVRDAHIMKMQQVAYKTREWKRNDLQQSAFVQHLHSTRDS